MKINSCIYEGTIRHRRFVENKREFQYRVFLMYVDLGEVDSVFNDYWLWSTKGPNVAWMRRADYLDGQSTSLADSVRSVVHDQLGVTPEGPIRLLTNFRYLGFGINPISLYYCFNDAEQLEFVVAEVTNTPWGEKQAYVLDGRGMQGRNLDAATRKLMHVSPFLDMEYEYRFQIRRPDEDLSVHIANHRLTGELAVEKNDYACVVDQSSDFSAGDQAEFDATLLLKRRQISSRNLAGVLCRYPMLTAQVFGKIHWQAFRLWMKGVAFKKHPKHRPKSDNDASSSSRSSDTMSSPTQVEKSMERHETTL